MSKKDKKIKRQEDKDLKKSSGGFTSHGGGSQVPQMDSTEARDSFDK